MKKEIITIETHCDYDYKIIENPSIGINTLDFCSLECLENYIKENEKTECSFCKTQTDKKIHKCIYCDDTKILIKTISEILSDKNDNGLSNKKV